MTASLPLNPLANPVPYEAALQLVRHISTMSTDLGYNFDYSGAVNLVPMNQTNSGVANSKRCVVNVAWDLDRCLDTTMDGFSTGITRYESTCFLNCYLWANENPTLQRGLLHADLHKYFFPLEQARWTLFNQNRERVVEELFIRALNIDLDFQIKPNIKVNVELLIRWGAVRDNLNWPR